MGKAMQTMKQDRRKTERRMVILWIALFATLTIHARPVSVPELPSATFTDTEISTNVAITVWTEHIRTFGIVLSLDATPSNNVEVAFGNDADADEQLTDEETDLTLGWDCGAWFVVSDEPTNSFTAIASGNTGIRREISFIVYLDSNGYPRHLDTFADGVPISFAGLDGSSPPEWLFSKTWNMLKITARGVDVHNEHVSIKLNTDPVVFLLR